MKIAIFSDLHLGFSPKSRETDAFDNAKKAMILALSENPDLIILPGDLFDESIPKYETLLEAFDILGLAKHHKKSETKIEINSEARNEIALHRKKKDSEEPIAFSGIPIIAIHGTHEYAGKDYKNVIHLLEASGFVAYLHGSQIFAEKGNEKVVIHGFGGVPEKKALDVLRFLNPQPIANAINLFILHQSIKEFLPFDDEMIASLSISDLPADFDLIIDGHLHWSNELDDKETGKHFLLPGSTVLTQMKHLESTKKKAVYFYDTKTKQVSFKEIPDQREFFYKKLQFKEANLQKLKDEINKALTEILSGKKFSKKPLIKLKILGTLSSGLNQADISEESLAEDFADKAIIAIDRNFSGMDDLKTKLKNLGELHNSKKSAISLGLDMLDDNLKKTDFNNAFDVHRVFKLLEEDEVDKAIEVILGKKE